MTPEALLAWHHGRAHDCYWWAVDCDTAEHAYPSVVQEAVDGVELHAAMASTIRGLKEESDLAMQIISENVKLRSHLSLLLAAAAEASSSNDADATDTDERTYDGALGGPDTVRFIYHGIRGETRYPLKHWDDMSPDERGAFAAIYEVLKNRQRRVRGPSGKAASYLLSPEELKAELDKPGRSQAALAREMGLDAAAVNRIVNGKREVKAREVVSIADYLNRTAPAN